MLSRKIVRKVEDVQKQQVINEEAEVRLLSIYIYGLSEKVGRQIRYEMPNTMQEAIEIEIRAYEEENRKGASGRKKAPVRVFGIQDEESKQEFQSRKT